MENIINNNIIEVDKLSYGYYKQKELTFCDVSFNIEYGTKKVCLLGESGSGKTTLLEILSGLIKGWFGKVKVNNQYLNHEKNNDTLSLSYIPEKAVMFENKSGLYNLNYARNVLGLDSLTIEAAEKTAKTFGFDIKTPVKRLNIIQKTIIEIERIKYKKPKILLIDRPSNVYENNEHIKTLFSDITNCADTCIISARSLDDVKFYGLDNSTIIYLHQGCAKQYKSLDDLLLCLPDDYACNFDIAIKRKFAKIGLCDGKLYLDLTNFANYDEANDFLFSKFNKKKPVIFDGASLLNYFEYFDVNRFLLDTKYLNKSLGYSFDNLSDSLCYVYYHDLPANNKQFVEFVDKKNLFIFDLFTGERLV